MRKLLVMLLAIGVPAIAQTSIKDALAKHWQKSADLTIAVAEAMPAEQYTFRPNPEEMSFGQLMAHIGAANQSACSAAHGERADFPPKIAAWAKEQMTVDIDKPTAVAYLKDVFAGCQKTVEGMTPETLDQSVGTGARAQTRFEILWGYFTHTAHHRGQAEVYLRLKGIKPPTYVF